MAGRLEGGVRNSPTRYFDTSWGLVMGVLLTTGDLKKLVIFPLEVLPVRFAGSKYHGIGSSFSKENESCISFCRPTEETFFSHFTSSVKTLNSK